MGLVLDTCCFGKYFKRPSHPIFEVIKQWVNNNHGQLDIPGSFFEKDEIKKCPGIHSRVMEMGKKNQARMCPKDRCETIGKIIQQNNELKSNDPHVLATAVCFKDFLLCSSDKLLEKDFKIFVPRYLNNCKRAKAIHIKGSAEDSNPEPTPEDVRKMLFEY